MAGVGEVAGLFLGVTRNLGICTQSGGEGRLLSDRERHALLFLPVIFKRDADMAFLIVGVDYK